MHVNTIEIDSETLSARKEVKTESVGFSTPAKALQVGKLRGSETVSPLTRVVAEIYATVDAAALRNSQAGYNVIAKRLGPQSGNAGDDEFIVPFIQYDDTATLTPENAAEIAKLETNYGDILTVPLMTPLVRAAEDGDDRTSEHVSAIIENTRVYLDAVEDLGITKPVMGVIPPISEDCTIALLDMYSEQDLNAYCVDFNRRSPMAQFQIDEVVNPLMGTLTAYGNRESSLIYSVNARNSRSGIDGRRTPDRMYSYTLGFDVVGDNHISPNWPEEVFEKIAQETEDEEIKLRLFDADDLSVAEVPMSELDSFIPDEAEIPIERIQDRIAKDPAEQYRFRSLINAELISLFLESEGGVDPDEIFTRLLSGRHSQDSDLQRVEGLVANINNRS
jgi:hypothetical protein